MPEQLQRNIRTKAPCISIKFANPDSFLKSCRFLPLPRTCESSPLQPRHQAKHACVLPAVSQYTPLCLPPILYPPASIRFTNTWLVSCADVTAVGCRWPHSTRTWSSGWCSCCCVSLPTDRTTRSRLVIPFILAALHPPRLKRVAMNCSKDWDFLLRTFSGVYWDESYVTVSWMHSCGCLHTLCKHLHVAFFSVVTAKILLTLKCSDELRCKRRTPTTTSTS